MTKERIKSVALALFARRGYEGTTMNEISKGVNIKKASLYSHFSGKEELFFEIYEDLAEDYSNLMERIINSSSHLGIEERLYFIFEQYIVYYIKNPEVEAFWNQIILFTPPHITERFYADWENCNIPVQKNLTVIFEEGIRQGVIRSDDTNKMVMSFLAFRDGLLYWIKTSPGLKEERIKDFWLEFWLGIKERD